MRDCPRCSFSNDDEVTVCAQCRAWLGWHRSTPGPGEPAQGTPPEDAPRHETPPQETPQTETPQPEAPQPGGGGQPVRAAPALRTGRAAPVLRAAEPPRAGGLRPVERTRRRVVAPPAAPDPAPDAAPDAGTTPSVQASPAPSTAPGDRPGPPTVVPAHPTARPPDGPAAAGVRAPPRPRLRLPDRPDMHGSSDRMTHGSTRGTSFEALRPDDTSVTLRPHDDTGTTPPRTAISGTQPELMVRCAYCQRLSAADRHFCRCGRTLPRPVLQPDREPLPETLPWHRRVRRSFGDDGFWQRMREANGGARQSFHRARDARDRAVALAAALGVTGLVVAQIGPWGDEVRSQAWDRAQEVLPSRFTTATGTRATSAAVAEPAGYWPAEHATDGDLLTAWAAPWVPLPEGETPGGQGEPAGCGRPDGAVALEVSLEAPTDVARVTVAAGLAEDSPYRERQVRPRTVAVHLDGAEDPTCMEQELADTHDQQVVQVRGEDVTSVRVEVLDVWQPGNPAPGPGLVAVSEVLVQRRG